MQKPDREIVLPSFPDYLNFADRPGTFTRKDLALAHTSFGLSVAQIRCVRDIVFGLSMIPSEQEAISGTTNKPITIDTAGRRALIAIIYFDFNTLVARREPNEITTLGKLLPRAQTAAANTRQALTYYPELRTYFPDPDSMIQDPQPPVNPSRKITLVAEFDPLPFMTNFKDSGDKSAQSASPEQSNDDLSSQRDTIIRKYYNESPHLEGQLGSKARGGLREVDWSKIDLDKFPE